MKNSVNGWTDGKPAKAAAAKKVRFSILIKQCGRPESLTLWSKPEANPVLKKAVRDNRVLTIFRTPKGVKKDIGRVGFHQHPDAIYLVFPKRLPKTVETAEVIGIQYALLAEAEQSVPSAKPAFPAKTGAHHEPNKKKKTSPAFEKSKSKPQPAPPPALKKFKVSFLRTGTSRIDIELKAESMGNAEKTGLEIIRRKKFQAETVEDEVKSITEIK